MPAVFINLQTEIEKLESIYFQINILWLDNNWTIQHTKKIQQVLRMEQNTHCWDHAIKKGGCWVLQAQAKCKQIAKELEIHMHNDSQHDVYWRFSTNFFVEDRHNQMWKYLFWFLSSMIFKE